MTARELWGVPVLAGSTFDTDRVLVPSTQADQTVAVQQQAGHTISPEEDA